MNHFIPAKMLRLVHWALKSTIFLLDRKKVVKRYFVLEIILLYLSNIKFKVFLTFAFYIPFRTHIKMFLLNLHFKE